MTDNLASWLGNDPRELVGKTITAAETGAHDADYGYFDESAITLRFSDGTSVVMRPTGYEADGIALELDSYTGRMRRGAKAAGWREARRVQRLADEVYRARRKAEHDHAKATLSPEAFEQWKRERDPHYIIKSIWGDEIRKALSEQSLLLNRQTFGGEQAVIPIKREAASDADS
jgi:hypothetical protein